MTSPSIADDGATIGQHYGRAACYPVLAVKGSQIVDHVDKLY